MIHKKNDLNVYELCELEELFREKNICFLCSGKLKKDVIEWEIDPPCGFMIPLHDECANKINDEFRAAKQLIIYKVFEHSKNRSILDAVFFRD